MSTATATVGVCGQAADVCPRRTSPANLVPNGSTRPPVTAAAMLAAAQISPFNAASAQQTTSTTQAAAVPPGAVEAAGPNARLTGHHSGGPPHAAQRMT